MRYNEIKLSETEKQELINLHSTIKDGKIRDRIKAIILLNDGYSKAEIEKILLITRRTILKLQNKFFKKGIKALLTDNNIGYEGKLSIKEKEELKKDLCEKIFSSAKEVSEHVKNKYNKEYKTKSMVQLLHRLGFSYKKTKHVPAKADLERQKEFLKTYEQLKEIIPKESKIYFMDAVHPQINSIPAYGWIEKGKDKEIKSNAGRERININGLFSLEDLEIITRQDITIDSESTFKLLKEAEIKHPELDLIFVIRDNARYYMSKYLSEKLKGSKIIMIPLPSYSPNLNLIERLWKFFKKKVLYNKYYEKAEDFRNAVSDFFNNSVNTMQDELKSLMTENFHLFGEKEILNPN